MKTLTKTLMTLAISITMLSSIGCQSNDKAQSNAQPVQEQTGQAAEQISEQPVYKVALNSNYAPFEFKDEKGSIVGYDIDLIEAIAEEEGFAVEVINLPFDELLTSVQKQKHDIAISAMKLNESRQEKLLASDPYFQTHEGFVVKDDSEIDSLNDLKNNKIAVLGDSHQHQKLEGDNASNVSTEATIFLAFKSLMMDEVDAVYSEEPILHFEANQFPENPVRFIPSDVDVNKYVIYTSKENEELMMKINHGLQELKDNGRYNQLTQKWFGDYAKEVELL